MSEGSFFIDLVGLTVGAIIALTGAEPRDGADLSRPINDLAPLDRAGIARPEFHLANSNMPTLLAATKAGAVLTTERFAALAPAGVAVLRLPQAL